MRIIVLIIFILASFGLIYQINELRNEEISRNKILNEEISKLNNLKSQDSKLNSDIDYYSLESNLLKEAKGIFNLHEPDEKMMIIIPKNP